MSILLERRIDPRRAEWIHQIDNDAITASLGTVGEMLMESMASSHGVSRIGSGTLGGQKQMSPVLQICSWVFRSSTSRESLYRNLPRCDNIRVEGNNIPISERAKVQITSTSMSPELRDCMHDAYEPDLVA